MQTCWDGRSWAKLVSFSAVKRMQTHGVNEKPHTNTHTHTSRLGDFVKRVERATMALSEVQLCVGVCMYVCG